MASGSVALRESRSLQLLLDVAGDLFGIGVDGGGNHDVTIAPIPLAVKVVEVTHLVRMRSHSMRIHSQWLRGVQELRGEAARRVRRHSRRGEWAVVVRPSRKA